MPAAGETDGLEPKVAVGWLAAALVLIAAAMIIGPRVCITSKLNLENSPEALTRDARNHIRNFGYTAKPSDSAWGLEYTEDYKSLYGVAFQRSRRAVAAIRRRASRPSSTSGIAKARSPFRRSASFMCRWTTTILLSSSPAWFAWKPTRMANSSALKPSHPRWKSRPHPPRHSIGTSSSWPRGSMPAKFQTAEPTWTPLANWDTRAAWTGTDPATGAKLRIEAAAWRGRPVFYRIIGPWTSAGRMTPPSSSSSLPFIVIIYIALLAASVLVLDNVRRGRADLRGATRLSLIYFLCLASVKLLQMHHTATLGEIDNFWTGIGGALVNGWSHLGLLCGAGTLGAAQVAAHYDLLDALHHERRFPDPLVGRDLLYGTVFGIVLDFGDVVGTLLCAPREQSSTRVPAAERNAGCTRRTGRCHRLGSRRHFHRCALLFHTLPAAPGLAQGVDCRHCLRQ